MKKRVINFLLFNVLALCPLLAQEDTTGVSLIETYSLEELINMKITTASRSEQQIKDVAANVEIITKETIAQYGYRDLSELLQSITGIYKIEDHYWLGSTNYGVRGYFKTGPFSNIAILINGVNQISDKYSDYPDVKISLPVEAIERIEIIKGPMAVVYGNGAFFGVINIITNDVNNTQESRIDYEQGFPNRNRFFAQLTGSAEDFKFKYIASLDHNDGLDVSYTDITTDTSYLKYVGLEPDGKTKNHLDLTKYYTGMNLIYKGFVFDFSYNQSDKGVFDGSPVINNGNNLKTQAVTTSLMYNKKIGDSWNLNGLINFYSHNHILKYELFRKYYYEVDMQNTNAISAEINMEYHPSDKFLLTSNISRRTILNVLQISDFAYYGLGYGDGIIGLPEGEHFSISGGYVQAQYKPVDKLTLLAGVRLEHLEDYNMYMSRGVVSEDSLDLRDPNDPANRYIIEEMYKPGNNGISFVPRLSMIYSPYPKHFFKLLFGEAQKQPSFSENYRQLPGGRAPLSAARIQTFELNYYTFALQNTIFNTSFFINHLDKLIENTNFFDQSTGSWDIYSANSGDYITHGVEGQMIFKPSNKLELDARFVVQKTRDLREGYGDIEVAYSPFFIGYFNAFYKFNNDLSLGANFRYLDSMESTWETSSTVENGSRIGAGSNENFLLHVNIMKQNLFDKKIYAGLKIWNLLNSEIRYPTTKSNKWLDKGALDQGMVINLKVGVKL